MGEKIARIIAIVVVSIVLVNIILFITFSIPSVQERAAGFALQKMEPVLNTEIALDGIRVRLFNTVELSGLYVEDQQQDTLFYAGKIAARLRVLDLLRGRITIQKAGIEDFNATLTRETAESPFNFQFIIDSFAKEPDTATVKEDKSLQIIAEDVVLKNGSLRYYILSAPATHGQFNSNHIHVDNFNFRGSAEYSGLDDLKAEILLLTFIERNSGIDLSRLEAEVVGKGSLLESDNLQIALNGSRIRVRNASFDTESKDFSLILQSEVLDPQDVGKFYEPLANLDKLLSFEIEADGQLPRANLNKLELMYGSDTRFEITGMIADVNDINNSGIEVDIQNLLVSQQDLESIIGVWAVNYTSPEQLTALGGLALQVEAEGKLSNFDYQGNIVTKVGEIELKGVGKMRDSFANLSFEGPVSAKNIQVERIIGEGAGIGDVTVHIDAKVGIPRDSLLWVTADGSIEQVVYKEYPYNDISFSGKYMGTNVAANLQMDSPANRFEIFSDITFGDSLGFIVDADIQQLSLQPFIMMEDWKDAVLTTRIEGEMRGSTIDDMAGTLLFDYTSLADSNFIYNPGPLFLQASANQGEEKKLHLYSTFLEAELVGDYYFSSIVKEVKQALHSHVPSVIPAQTEIAGYRGKGKKNRDSDTGKDWDAGTDNQEGTGERYHSLKNRFQFNIMMNNTEDLSYVFALPFYNVEQATISGSVDMESEGTISIKGQIPRLMFGNNDVRETTIDLQGDGAGIALGVNSYLVQNNGYINVRLKTGVAGDSVINSLSFDVQKSDNHSNGELLITVGFENGVENMVTSKVHIHPTTIDFNGKDIDINDATIAFQKERIEISNFGIREKDMLLLGIAGVASKSEADNIRIYFNNTELANILTAFNISNLSGSINGDIYVRQALETPMIHTDRLRIEDITVNRDTVGTLLIEGSWDQMYSGLNLNAHLSNEGERNLEIGGYIPTGDESPFPMDVNILMEDFELHVLQPLAINTFSSLSGKVNSNINISGRLSEPVTEGWLGIEDGEMRVAYTNVTYYLSDTIQIKRDNVGLENLVIRDQNNHEAVLNLSLSHNNFGRMAYTASIRLNDFMLLNNEDRTDLMAYGKLSLTGDLKVAGSPAGIYGEGNITTKSLSEVTVVLPQTAKATEYRGIVYINTPEQDSLHFLRRGEGLIDRTKSSASPGIPISMRATVNLNPMLTAGVILDPTTGNALEVNGEGELSINFNSRSTPPLRLYGDYVINEGKFHYNLQNLKAIDFTIREGSRLTMAGNPLNTQFNITAFLPVRADLSALSPTFATELANTRVPVNALLRISGGLESMDLQYDIELPESSSDIQQRVNSFINTEETKILQFAYLATTGSFIPSEGSPDLHFGSSVFTKFAANTLSRGLDALFASALSDNWSVSTNLESVDGTLDNVRMGVDVSTRLMNNRLRISTNLSYGDNSMLASKQQFMGEFDLEYDINNWLMFRAFNRANERFSSRWPTTQGAGFMVTKEGQSIRDLFDFRFVRP